MNEICLVVIYNHKYEKNISVIDRIYKGRFSNVYHVMPFYEGTRCNVIGVYESSYQFQGYIAQAARQFRNDRYSHFVFVADDMVLAPHINEGNILDVLKLDNSAAFISNKPKLMDRSWVLRWPHGLFSLACFNAVGNACEWRGEMPSIEEAREKFEEFGLDWRNGVSENFWRFLSRVLKAGRNFPYSIQLLPVLKKFHRFIRDSKENVYPMAYGYSDFLVIPATTFDMFCRYCGVFAAMRVFVEVAIPTSMIFSCQKIKSLDDIGLKAENGVNDYRARVALESSTELSYGKLIRDYPKDYLYIHPVKLSKWKDLP